MQSLFQRILDTVNDRQMLVKAPVELLLMVSGGADSVALAYILPMLLPDNRYTILHVNHGIRGLDADADESFVRSLAHELSIPCVIRRINLPEIKALTGGNLEELGRNMRYSLADELLAELAGDSASDNNGRIITAHTADDNAATFLMRVIKGGGAASLSGIPYVRGKIIRPLLDVRRYELIDWLVSEGHTWCEDATNIDTNYLRAFVRHQLLPLMQTQNPRLIETITRSQKILADESDYIGHIASAYQTDPLSASHPAIARRALRLAYQANGGQSKDLTFEHVEQLRLRGKTAGFVIDLPGAISARNVGGELVFSTPESCTTTEQFIAVLETGRPLEIPQGTLVMEEVDPVRFTDDPVAFAKANADDCHLLVDGEALTKAGLSDTDRRTAIDLTVASLQAGDRFSPLGMPGQHKLVSDLLIDRKIPQSIRQNLVKISKNGEIVWVVGVQADDRFKVRPDSIRIISIIMRLHSIQGSEANDAS
ncbi:MAG: tRNA lysidine(34) synthetase TilS [Coriobacteriales bacterium]|nr:tRNA lysidine(34) synthetase TilS [Coriobacteriales bacterium]